VKYSDSPFIYKWANNLHMQIVDYNF